MYTDFDYSYFGGNKMTCESLTLHKDKRGYYLDAKYTYENPRSHSIHRLHIPKMRIGDLRGDVTIQHSNYGSDMSINIGLGLGWRNLEPVEMFDENEKVLKQVYFTDTVIKENKRKMSLEEIEKALGYKIELTDN